MSYTLPVGQVLSLWPTESASVSCTRDFCVPNNVELMWLLLDLLEAESLLDGPSIDVQCNKSSAHMVSECIDSTGDAGEDISSLLSIGCGPGGGVRNTGNMRSCVGKVLGVGLLFCIFVDCSLGSGADLWTYTSGCISMSWISIGCGQNIVEWRAFHRSLTELLWQPLYPVLNDKLGTTDWLLQESMVGSQTVRTYSSHVCCVLIEIWVGSLHNHMGCQCCIWRLGWMCGSIFQHWLTRGQHCISSLQQNSGTTTGGTFHHRWDIHGVVTLTSRGQQGAGWQTSSGGCRTEDRADLPWSLESVVCN